MRFNYINQAMEVMTAKLTLALLLVCIYFVPFTAVSGNETVQQGSFAEQLHALIAADYTEKEQIILSLTAIEDKQVLLILRSMADSRLFYIKNNERVVLTEERDAKLYITDAITGEALGLIESDAVKKINLNNKLRSQLKNEIAKLSLMNSDRAVRLAAINELIASSNEESIALLRARQGIENDAEVIAAINAGIAIADISSEDRGTRIRAILSLRESLIPQARQALESIVSRDDAGKYIETDQELRKHAQRTLAGIQAKVRAYYLAETIFFGISLGSVLLLSAIGLAITFGVMGVINMAHGELMMIGAYTTYIIQSMFPNLLEYSLFISIPAAFIVSGLFGIAIERGIIRFLYGRPLETLLATFGVSLILQQLVRSTISAQNVIVSTPAWMSGSLQINPVLSITYNRLYIIVFSLFVFVALLYVLKKSVLGLQVRAVSQNRNMARAMGVRSARVDALTFGLGSGIAGVAGVALSQLTNVGPNLGQSYIIDSFMVVVFGGVGNLWGTLVGAMSLGVINKFLEPVSGAVLAKILLLLFIILFIQKKPRGLFPQKGRSAEN